MKTSEVLSIYCDFPVSGTFIFALLEKRPGTLRDGKSDLADICSLVVEGEGMLASLEPGEPMSWCSSVTSSVCIPRVLELCDQGVPIMNTTLHMKQIESPG